LAPELPSRVTVTRAAGVFGPWMAEYTLGWCLFVTQRMAFYRDAQRAREWRGDVMPDRVSGTTMVIVGLGEIGRTSAAARRRLGLRVVGVSRPGRRTPRGSRVHPPSN